MKKLFKIVLAFTIVGLMFACDATTTSTPTQNSEVDNSDTNNGSDDSNNNNQTQNGGSSYEVSEDGKKITYEINKGTSSYVKYVYTKQGDINLSVQPSSGDETNLSIVPFVETIDTTSMHAVEPQVKIETDSIKISSYKSLAAGVNYRKGATSQWNISFYLNSFLISNPTTGTYSADRLIMSPLDNTYILIHGTSFDVEVTLAQKVGDDIHLVGNFTLDNPSSDISKLTLSFDVLAKVKPDNVYK